jgi:hypothetical protein
VSDTNFSIVAAFGSIDDCAAVATAGAAVANVGVIAASGALVGDMLCGAAGDSWLQEISITTMMLATSALFGIDIHIKTWPYVSNSKRLRR